MKPLSQLQVFLCCLGGLLIGSPALAQQDPRMVIVKPTTAKAGGARPSSASAQRVVPVAKRIWADYAGKAIRRSDLDGSNVETLAVSADGPYGTTYDPETGYVIWTSSGAEVVQMAPAYGATSNAITLTSSFEEYFGVVVNGSESSETNVAYGVVDGQVIRVTRKPNTDSEQRDVLLTLSSPDAVHGLALTPDTSALSLGDTAGRMTPKLNLSTLQVTQLVYDNAASSPQPAASAQPHEEPSTQEAFLARPSPLMPTWNPESLYLEPTLTPRLLAPASTPRFSSTETTR